MKNTLLMFFFLFPILGFSQEKDYSYTFIDINTTYSNDIGYVGDIYLGLPASLYLKGSVRDPPEMVNSV